MTLLQFFFSQPYSVWLAVKINSLTDCVNITFNKARHFIDAHLVCIIDANNFIRNFEFVSKHNLMTPGKLPEASSLIVRQKKKTEPNKALEPMPMSVTFRAYARPAPALVMAHL
jgi:hypothetical protein